MRDTGPAACHTKERRHGKPFRAPGPTNLLSVQRISGHRVSDERAGRSLGPALPRRRGLRQERRVSRRDGVERKCGRGDRARIYRGNGTGALRTCAPRRRASSKRRSPSFGMGISACRLGVEARGRETGQRIHLRIPRERALRSAHVESSRRTTSWLSRRARPRSSLPMRGLLPPPTKSRPQR